MNNGVSTNVEVTIPATASHGAWTSIEVQSYRSSTTSPPAGEDPYHIWLVGVYVP
jgi:hypothetical protein